MMLIIRNEKEDDYRTVENLTREAFWNLHVPGCDEHYLAHVMRFHPDFIPKLDFVALYDDTIVGNIMYTKSTVVDTNDRGHMLDTITFGPVSVLPEFQKKGFGSKLIRYSIERAAEYGYKAIIIQGHPHNYCKYGFKSAKDFNISDTDGKYPFSLLVLELEKGYFENCIWRYISSPVYSSDEAKTIEFDKHFENKKREYTSTQEVFSIASRAYLV